MSRTCARPSRLSRKVRSQDLLGRADGDCLERAAEFCGGGAELVSCARSVSFSAASARVAARRSMRFSAVGHWPMARLASGRTFLTTQASGGPVTHWLRYSPSSAWSARATSSSANPERPAISAPSAYVPCRTFSSASSTAAVSTGRSRFSQLLATAGDRNSSSGALGCAS